MRTFLRRFLKTLITLACLLVLFHVVENWRGKRAWTAWQKSREAQGDRFDVESFAPPAVPDAENFGADPLIAAAVVGKGWKGMPPTVGTLASVMEGGIGDWRMGRREDLQEWKAKLGTKDLEQALSPYADVLEGVSRASKRPHNRFLVEYQHSTEMPALVNFRAVARVLRLRALARLHGGHPDAAFEDVMTGIRVIQHLQKEPHLITQLLRIAYVRLMMQPIWEGLQDHRWNVRQLSVLQENLRSIDLLESLKRSFLFERTWDAWSVEQLEKVRFGAWLNNPLTETLGIKLKINSWVQALAIPKGWGYQGLIFRDQAFLAQSIDPIDPVNHRVDAELARKAKEKIFHMHRTPYNFLWMGDLIAFSELTARVAQAQAGLDQAEMACALERYRLDKGRYPASLDLVLPANGDSLRTDLMTGQPLHYQLHSDGTYLIYSVGWDGVDDGGKVVLDDQKPPRAVNDKGDWAWVSPK